MNFIPVSALKIFIWWAVLIAPLIAAPGDLDTTFGGTGKVTTDLGSDSGGQGDAGFSVAVQGDGKVILAGSKSFNGAHQNFALVRYNANGSLDTTFNGSGKVITAIGDLSSSGYSVALQTDGKNYRGGPL